MPNENINRNQPKQNLLVSMLDWGLGHTTRTIPLLIEFQNKGFHITIAGTEAQINFLKNELPEAKFIFLKGYNIHYSNSKFWFTWKILLQLPKIAIRIFKEHQWLKKYIKNNKIDVILSDNRPGFFSNSIYSIYLTHQLTVKAKFKYASVIATFLHNFFIQKFNVCWVPDTETNTLAGELSITQNKRLNIKYIGPISRFHYADTPKTIRLLIILSGPEPMRTILENKLIDRLKNVPQKVVFIRGTTTINPKVNNSKTEIQFIDRSNSKELNLLINQSQMVVSRSGYTTIMDLLKTKSRALLIPTPGQPEQEYIAKNLSEKGLFLFASQSRLQISDLVNNPFELTQNVPETIFEKYKSVINDLIRKMN